MRQVIGLCLLLAACGGGGRGDGGAAFDGAACGPNTCGTCPAGSVPNDGCAGGVWICTCITTDMNANVTPDLSFTDLATSRD